MPANQIIESIQSSFRQSGLDQLRLSVSGQQYAEVYRLRAKILNGLGSSTTRILAELSQPQHLTDYDFKLIRRSFYRSVESEFKKISALEPTMRPLALSFLASIATKFNRQLDHLIDEYSVMSKQTASKTNHRLVSILKQKISALLKADLKDIFIEQSAHKEAGIVLKRRPALSKSPNIKFAATYHRSFKDRELFSDLHQFLPRELCFFAAPDKSQNSFSFALSLPNSIDKIDFCDELRKRSYKLIGSLETPQAGDIICYYQMFKSAGFSHAGILINESQVISRWGQAGPVMLHPLEQLPPELRGDIGNWEIYRAEAI